MKSLYLKIVSFFSEIVKWIVAPRLSYQAYKQRKLLERQRLEKQQKIEQELAAPFEHAFQQSLWETQLKQLATLPLDNESLLFMKRLSKRVIRLMADIMPFVGIQPMQGPVALAYLMRYKADSHNQENEPSNDDFKRLILEVVSQAVEASSRKLAARYTLETAQDLAVLLHGIDAEEELLDVLSQEIIFELKQYVYSLIASLNDTETVDVTDNMPYMGVYINKFANEIGAKSRRGCANFIIVSPAVLTILQTHASSCTPKDCTPNTTTLPLCGLLNGSIKVYVDQSMAGDYNCIIGYKGSSDIDAGIIINPYVPISSAGVTLDPTTLQPFVNFFYRGGNVIDEASPHYYKVVNFTGLNFISIPEDR